MLQESQTQVSAVRNGLRSPAPPTMACGALGQFHGNDEPPAPGEGSKYMKKQKRSLDFLFKSCWWVHFPKPSVEGQALRADPILGMTLGRSVVRVCL